MQPGAALLFHNRSSPSVLDCIFLYNIFKIKPDPGQIYSYLYRALHCPLIDVITLSGVAHEKEASDRLMELQYNGQLYCKIISPRENDLDISVYLMT